MDQITSIITSSAMSILVVLTGIVVQAIKNTAYARGRKAIEIVEILAKNAVRATEQVADKLDIHGTDSWNTLKQA